MSTLPPISALEHLGHAQHAPQSASSQSASTLPSISSLISQSDRTATPHLGHGAISRSLLRSPRSPPRNYKPTVPDHFTSSASQHGPATAYPQQHHSSVSPTAPPTYSHHRYSSISNESKHSLPEQTSYLTPQSPRRMSFAQPTQAWPAPVPQNYVFHAQPAGAPYAQYHAQTAVPAGTHFQQPPPPTYAPSTQQWHADDAEHDAKRPKIYSDSVKTHLDTFDLEHALNVISDSSKQVFDFSNHYSQRAHQTQRSGPLPGSTPNIMEIDEMMRHGSDMQESLVRLREVMVAQQAALAERSKEQMQKAANASALDDSYAQDQGKDGGFGGLDSKKRRGRAAPPGRCHSCNRAETPEWRRGPDGARTLCNACGLHYAKLTRKLGNKTALPASSLRRSIDVGTPAI